MKKTKYIYLALAGMMGLALLSGCGKKETAVVDKEEQKVMKEQQEEVNEALKEQVGQELSINDIGNYEYSTVDFYGFDNDVIWVEDGQYLVNTDGKVVYSLAGNNNYQIERYGSESDYYVQDGYSYFRLKLNDNQDVAADIVINNQGEEVIRLISSANEKYRIIGYGNGNFVVVYNKMNKDAFGTYLYTIDTNGKVITNAKHVDNVDTDYSENYFDSAEYLGDDIFKIGDLIYYNAKEGTITRLADSSSGIRPFGKFYDGKIVLVSTSGEYYVASSDEFKEDRINYAFTTKISDQILAGVDSIESYTNGKIFGHTNILQGESLYVPVSYNLDATQNDWFKPYQKYRDVAIQPYEDGYIVVSFLGADSNRYLTILDENGKELYSPISFGKEYYGSLQDIYQKDGYIQMKDQNGELIFVYPDGSIHKWSDNLKDMKKLQFGAVGSGYLVVGSSDTNDSADFNGENSGIQSYYKFRSLKKTDWFTCEITKKTKTLNLSDWDTTKPPKIEEMDAKKETQEDIKQDDTVNRELDYELDDTEIFNQEGVSVTLTSENTLRMENKNAENKIVTVQVTGVAFNGIYDAVYNSSNNITAQSGYSEELSMADTFADYARFMADVSKTLAEIPIMEITLEYTVQIGKDAEPVIYTNTIQTQSYDEEKFNAYYGDKIGDYMTQDGCSISVYRIKTDTGIGALVRNNTADANIRVTAGEKWLVNGIDENTGYRMMLPREIPGNMGAICHYEDIAESVRKRQEIPNDKDVELTLIFSATGDESTDGTEFQIPVGTIE